MWAAAVQLIESQRKARTALAALVAVEAERAQLVAGLPQLIIVAFEDKLRRRRCGRVRRVQHDIRMLIEWAVSGRVDVPRRVTRFFPLASSVFQHHRVTAAQAVACKNAAAAETERDVLLSRVGLVEAATLTGPGTLSEIWTGYPRLPCASSTAGEKPAVRKVCNFSRSCL